MFLRQEAPAADRAAVTIAKGNSLCYRASYFCHCSAFGEAVAEGAAGCWVGLPGCNFSPIVALLAGCLIVYLLVRDDRAGKIGAYALGIAAGWVLHLITALVALRK
jgi:hypothetical protein